MNSPLFAERQSLRWLVILMLAMLMIVVYGTTQAIQLTKDEIVALLIAPLAVSLILWGFSRMTTIVTGSELRFGFPIFRKRFDISVVHVGEIVPISFWHGIGIHFVQGYWVWNAHLGRGVRVRIGNSQYVIGSLNPEKLQNALLTAGSRRMAS